jgi:hypothetical protein
MAIASATAAAAKPVRRPRRARSTLATVWTSRAGADCWYALEVIAAE